MDSTQEEYTRFHNWTIVSRIIGQALVGVFVLGILAFLVRFFVFGVSRVDGPSMEPSFVDQEWFVFEKISYAFRPPARFDVVEMIDPLTKRFLVKRIIGLPGEVVHFRSGSVFIRGRDGKEKKLDEPFLKHDTYTVGGAGGFEDQSISVGEHQYVVLGDNRLQSANDSRAFGVINRSFIVGRVLAK